MREPVPGTTPSSSLTQVVDHEEVGVRKQEPEETYRLADWDPESTTGTSGREPPAVPTRSASAGDKNWSPEAAPGFGGGWRRRKKRAQKKVRIVASRSLDRLDVLLREGLRRSGSAIKSSRAAAAAARATGTGGVGNRGIVGSVIDLTVSPASSALPSDSALRGGGLSLTRFFRSLPAGLLERIAVNEDVSGSAAGLPSTHERRKKRREEAGHAARLRRRSIKKRRGVATMPRVFCVSDIHTDHKENMHWVQSLSKENYKDDTIIIGGDVSDNREILEKTLAAFRARFKHVFFVPGNHDLWLRKEDAKGTRDSLDKLHELLDLCESLGVQTRPAKVDGVWIVPMLSWHHASFDTEPDIEGWKGIPSHREAMMDFKLCRWPPQWSAGEQDEVVARKIDKLNDELCSSSPWEYTTLPDGCEGVKSWDELVLACAEARRAGEPVISFSHFLPHIELLPEKRMLFFPNLAKAVGSTFLRQRVEKLRPTAHIFGHTHFAWDATIGGTRYLQVPLAKPSERRVRMRSLAIGDIELEPLCVWEGEKFCETHRAHWSEYYKHNERDPYNTRELASWVAKLYTKL